MIVDSAEPAIIRNYLKKRNHTVQRLEYGDFWMKHPHVFAAIQRKAVKDLIQSVWDDRLNRDLRMCLEHADITFLLVEGVYGVGKNGMVYIKGRNQKMNHMRLLSGLADLTMYGINILWNMSGTPLTSASLLDKMDSDLSNPQYVTSLLTSGRYKKPLWPKAKPGEVGLASMRIGIGPKTAKRLLSILTLNELSSLSLEEMKTLPGIGNATADKLWKACNGKAYPSNR